MGICPDGVVEDVVEMDDVLVGRDGGNESAVEMAVRGESEEVVDAAELLEVCRGGE